ncbi:MAG: cyclic pyranopterin monophosphate synthase MoaC [Planctomycetota bacterium]
MTDLPHFDSEGHVHMVDVGKKPTTHRVAVASAVITMQPSTLQRIKDRKFAKGDVFELARVAGVMGSKRTADLIPLCHPLTIDSVQISVEPIDDASVRLVARVSTHGKTGVEMEAMTAVMAAGLTVYDMCKSVDRSMTIGPVQLDEKLGGKSGHFVRSPQK